MSNKKISEEFINAQEQNKSGKLQIVGLLDGSSKYATVDFSAGIIVNVNIGPIKGIEAAKLIGDMQIINILFLKNSNISPEIISGTPDFNTLLNILSNEKQNNENVSLVEDAAEKLKKILGAAGDKILGKILEKNHPDEDIDVFLDKCVEAVSSIVGNTQAQKIFGTLRK